jgi:dolichol kinase
MDATLFGAPDRAGERVREILRDADPSMWRAERSEELRRRVRQAVEDVRAAAVALEARAGRAEEALREPLRSLAGAMERALPTEATRARWAVFVGQVHPEYEAFVAARRAMPGGDAVPGSLRPTNYHRNVFHVTAAATGLAGVTFLPSPAWVVAVSGAFAVAAWTMELSRRLDPRVNVVLMKIFGPVAHPHERYRVNSATWYATALVLLALFASRPAQLAAVAVLGIGDPVAALVGRRWGRHRIVVGRSVEGTAAFFVSSMLAALAVLAIDRAASGLGLVAFAALSAMVGALAELVTRRLDDNLTIPLAVGLVATLASPLL